MTKTHCRWPNHLLETYFGSNFNILILITGKCQMNNSCYITTLQLIWLCSQSNAFRFMSVITPNRFTELTNCTELNRVSNDFFSPQNYICSTHIEFLDSWAASESGQNLLLN